VACFCGICYCVAEWYFRPVPFNTRTVLCLTGFIILAGLGLACEILAPYSNDYAHYLQPDYLRYSILHSTWHVLGALSGLCLYASLPSNKALRYDAIANTLKDMEKGYV
jgi:hypothetical protein